MKRRIFTSVGNYSGCANRTRLCACRLARMHSSALKSRGHSGRNACSACHRGPKRKRLCRAMRPAYLPGHPLGVSGRGGPLLHTHQLSQFSAAAREARAHRSDRYAERFSSLLIGQIFQGDEQDDLSIPYRQLCHRAFQVAQLQRGRCVVHRSEVVVKFFNIKA